MSAEQRARELASLREDVQFYRQWSNELAGHVPEEYDDDVAQEAIISKWVTDMVAEVAWLRNTLTEVQKTAIWWAGQPTDYDEDTEQQIEDGRTLLAILDPTKESPQ